MLEVFRVHEHDGYIYKDFLKEKGIEFKDVNVAEDTEAAKEMVEKSGQMGVPQMEINGKIIIGFDKPAIEKELEGHKQD